MRSRIMGSLCWGLLLCVAGLSWPAAAVELGVGLQGQELAGRWSWLLALRAD